MWWEFLLLHTVISSVPTSHRTVYSLESKWWCTLNFSVWLHEIMFCSVLSVFFWLLLLFLLYLFHFLTVHCICRGFEVAKQRRHFMICERARLCVYFSLPMFEYMYIERVLKVHLYICFVEWWGRRCRWSEIAFKMCVHHCCCSCAVAATDSNNSSHISFVYEMKQTTVKPNDHFVYISAAFWNAWLKSTAKSPFNSEVVASGSCHFGCWNFRLPLSIINFG